MCVILSRCVQMCVWGWEGDLWEGCLGVRMSGAVSLDVCADVWVYMYDQVSGYLSVECAASGGRYLGSGLWVGLGMVCLAAGICVEL